MVQEQLRSRLKVTTYAFSTRILTGKKEIIEVNKTIDLSKEDVARMIIEATKFNEIDEQRRETAEALSS